MRYHLGRLLQMIGLIVPLVGVAGNMARPEDIPVKSSLAFAVVGVGTFYLGYVIQGKTPE